jgi:hypothetical protein
MDGSPQEKEGGDLSATRPSDLSGHTSHLPHRSVVGEQHEGRSQHRPSSADVFLSEASWNISGHSERRRASAWSGGCASQAAEAASSSHNDDHGFWSQMLQSDAVAIAPDAAEDDTDPWSLLSGPTRASRSSQDVGSLTHLRMRPPQDFVHREPADMLAHMAVGRQDGLPEHAAMRDGSSQEVTLPSELLGLTLGDSIQHWRSRELQSHISGDGTLPTRTHGAGAPTFSRHMRHSFHHHATPSSNPARDGSFHQDSSSSFKPARDGSCTLDASDAWAVMSAADAALQNQGLDVSGHSGPRDPKKKPPPPPAWWWNASGPDATGPMLAVSMRT